MPAALANVTLPEAILLRSHMQAWQRARAGTLVLPGGRALRPSQRTPPGDWRTWLILAGRGWGKTLTGAEDLGGYGEANPGSRLAVVARTFSDARDTCVEGESGLLSVLRPSSILTWNRSLGELLLTNGTRFKLFSAEEPDRLRGPQHHRAWADEVAAWGKSGAERQWPAAWDQLQFGLRLGAAPRLVATTTPRSTKLIRHLVDQARSAINPDGMVELTRGHTDENRENLAAAFLAEVTARYGGTRLGRQELAAELLEDVEGALWNYLMLEDRRPCPATLPRVVVGVDPSGGTNEQGIVVAGKGVDARGYVLADRSCLLSPAGWGARAVQAYLDFKADKIVVERNFGGDMALATIQTAARAMGVIVKVEMVTASRAKAIRAQPVAALYEQGRVSHTDVFPELEDELTSWTPEGGPSPNRLDALVWALTDLMVGAPPPPASAEAAPAAGAYHADRRNNAYSATRRR